MRTYRCKCGNLKLLKEGEERYPPSGKEGGEDENGRSPVVVVRGGKVEILFPSLSKNYSNGITRCLICNVNVYRAIDGDKTVEVLVGEGEGEHDHESPAFSASLGLLVPSASSSSTFSPSRPRRFPSPPAVPTSYAPPTTLLQTAPEPFFLPHPFSPNHPAFHSITLNVDDHLRLERQRLVEEIASFLDAKRSQFEALSDKTRKDVEEVWKIFEDGQREREEEERLGGPNGAGGGEMDKVVEGVATPIKTTERFPKELEMSSSISSLPRPTSSTSVGSYKAGFILPPSSSNSSSALASPALPRHPSTILSPTSSTNIPPPTSSSTSIPTTTATGPTSLLSASLSRGSYLLSRPPAYYDDRPRPPLDPIPSPPPPSGFTHHPSPPRIETDLDLASSMIASTWQEPANLIFRSNKHHPMPPPPGPKRKGSHQHEHPETVREEREEAGISRIGGAALGEGAVSASFKEREERMGEQPVAKTPPQSGGRGSNGGGEQEIGFIEEEERRRAGLDRRNAKEGKEVGGAKGKNGKESGKSPKRKVTFLEPTTSAELEEEGEYEPGEEGGEAILDGNHEEVFDFEEPELPSSSPSPSPQPTDEASTPLPPFTLLRSTSSSSTTATIANLASTSAPSSSNDVLPDSQADARPSRSIEKDEPMYTLDGRSALRPVPTAKSHSRSPSADRRTEAEKELQGENNRVLVSMKKLTAADLPSHRAAWKDKPRDWQIFGRFGGRPGGGRSVTSSSSDDGAEEEPPSVHYGQSLPVNILPPPGSTSKPPLEHKTSYTDEPNALVPPLRAATRRVSTTIATNRSSSHSSTSGDLVRRTSSSSGTRRTSTAGAGSSRSMPAAVMDPGPGLVEDEEDSESTGAGDSGFVPPHLRGRTTEEEEGVLGWASSVVG